MTNCAADLHLRFFYAFSEGCYFSHDSFSRNNRAATQESRSSGFPTRSDTKRSLQSQKRARILKFWI